MLKVPFKQLRTNKTRVWDNVQNSSYFENDVEMTESHDIS